MPFKNIQEIDKLRQELAAAAKRSKAAEKALEDSEKDLRKLMAQVKTTAKELAVEED